MWALLDTDDKTVIACIPPDVSYEDAKKEANGRTLIEMTINNSPAYINGIYKDGIFYLPPNMEKEN